MEPEQQGGVDDDGGGTPGGQDHQTGVPQTPVGYTPEWIPDWDRMCRGIADLVPMFPPGTRTAYQSLNYGYIVGEILSQR